MIRSGMSGVVMISGMSIVMRSGTSAVMRSEMSTVEDKSIVDYMIE